MQSLQKLRKQNSQIMPKDWNLVTLGQTANIQGGYAFKSNIYADHGVRLLRITNVSFGFIDLKDTIRLPASFLLKYPKFSLQDGDIVLVLTRPLTEGGIKAAKIQKQHLPILLNQRVGKFVIRQNYKLERDFLYYTIFSERFIKFIKQRASVTHQPNISPADIEEFLIPLPKFAEQQKIAYILSKIDDLIQKTDQIIERTQRLKKGLMRKLLTKGIGHTKFRHTFYGDIPEQWEIIDLGEIVRSYKNGIYKKSIYPGQGVSNIRMFNIIDGRIDPNGAPLLEVTEDEQKQYELIQGDILINRVNSSDLVGKAGIVDHHLGKVVFDSMNIRLRVKPERCDPYFLSYFLNTSMYYRQIRSSVKNAVAQSSLNQDDLNKIKIGIPIVQEQKRIAVFLSRMDQKIQQEKFGLSIIEKLKIGLMQNLLTGKIRVRT